MNSDFEWSKGQNLPGATMEWGLNFGPITGIPLNYYTLHMISQMLNENPLIKQCVEVGQFTGTISTYLGMESVARGIKECHSFEIQKQTSVETDRLLERLGVKTHFLDTFKYTEEVIDVLKKEVSLVFLDGGNKKLEFEIFVPHIPQHSIIMIHDFSIETKWEDFVIHADKLVPVNPHLWNRLNCQTAIFKKIV